jgi:putative oxidoreductase
MAQRITQALERFAWVPILLSRLFVGYFFLETGWTKIHNLDAMTNRFTQWGIPWPAFNAALSGYTEFVGGLLVLIGLCTRLVSIPLVINMAVAVVAVKLSDVTSLNDFVELDEPLYALVFFWLIFTGPGPVSVDHLLMAVFRRWSGKPPVTEAPALTR